MKPMEVIAKHITRVEVVEAVNHGSVEEALDALEHYARLLIEAVGVEIRVEGPRIIVEDHGKPAAPPLRGENPTDRHKEIVWNAILAWEGQLEGALACREAIERNDAPAAALHMTRAMLGLLEHESQTQELIDGLQRAEAGKVRAQQQVEQNVPMRKAARELLKQCPDEISSVSGKAKWVRQQLTESKAKGMEKPPSEVTLRRWFTEDSKR